MNRAGFTVPAPEEALNYLQLLTYELEGLRVLNCQIAAGGQVRGAWFRRYLRAYQRKAAEQQLALLELAQQLAPQIQLENYRWEADFPAGALRFIPKEAGHGV